MRPIVSLSFLFCSVGDVMLIVLDCGEVKKLEDEEGEFDLGSELKGEIDQLSDRNKKLAILTSPHGDIDVHSMLEYITGAVECSSEQLVMKLVKRYNMEVSGYGDRISYLENKNLLENVQKKTIKLIELYVQDINKFNQMTRNGIIMLHLFLRGHIEAEKNEDISKILEQQTCVRYKNRRLINKSVSVRSIVVEENWEPSFLSVSTADYAIAITSKLSRDFRRIKSDDLMNYATGKKSEVF